MPSAVLASRSPSAWSRLLLASSATSLTHTYARADGGETRARPDPGNARGEAGLAEGRGKESRRRLRVVGSPQRPSHRFVPLRSSSFGSFLKSSRSFVSRCWLPAYLPLPASHLATDTHKQISDNGHAPSPTVSSTIATVSPTKPGRGTIAFGCHRRQVAREFHGNVAPARSTCSRG